MLKKILLTGIAGALLFTGSAFAQESEEDTQEAVIPTEAKARQAAPGKLAIEMGIGVANFNGDLGGQINAGPSWDLRGIIRPNETIGGELAYVGSASGLDGPDFKSREELDGTALTSAGDAMVRFNALNDEFLQPFASVGLGVLGVDVRDQNTTVDRGTALTLPVGAGLQVYTKSALTLGARFNYRILTDIVSNDLASGDNWNAGVNVGATF